MKNQVNRKASKLLIALLSLVIMCVAVVALAACNDECTHPNMKDGVDTATCTSSGLLTHTCEDCGYTYMTPTSAKPHTYGAAEKVAATCTEKGYTVKECTVCGYEVKSDYEDATGHANTKTSVTEATCVKDGMKIVTCQDCGTLVSMEAIAAAGHTLEVKETVAATCGKDGYVVKECSVCKEEVIVKGEAATGDHTYVTASEAPATCTAMGLKVEVCEVCGAEHTEVLPVVGHTFTVQNVAATCTVKAHKEKTCDVCAYTESYDYEGELADHAYKLVSETAATCVSAGKRIDVCTVCADERIIDRPATGEHTYSVEAVKVEATCISEGYNKHTCSVCMHELKKNVTPALGHAFDVAQGATVVKAVAATCLNDGYNIVSCARCDVQSTVATEVATGHNYVEESVVAAGCLTEGYTLMICDKCDVSKKVDVVAAAGHKYAVVNEVAATCTTDGSKLYDCTVCGVQKTEVIKTAGHTWGEDVVINATCTTPEYTYKVCGACGAKNEPVETAPALNPAGHVLYTEVVVAATCISTGEGIIKCENCTYEEETVLGITPHTYYIADAVAAGAIEALQSDFPALYEKYLEKGEEYYYSVSVATCEGSGIAVKSCDYCEQRYTADVSVALGHDFETITVAATCYNGGYEVLSCTRCAYEAGERTAVTPVLLHKMTVANVNDPSLPALVLYAKEDAGVLTIYRDELMTTELTAAEYCNVFAVGAEEEYLVFKCDVCAEKHGDEYISEESRVETDRIYTDPLTGDKYVIYATTASNVEYTNVESVDHVYSDAADTADSDMLVCEQERKEIYYCTNCKAADRPYNQTILTEGADGKFVNDKGHYGDVAYVWYYHELPGVPTEAGYDYDDSGVTIMINTMTGAACTSDATYNYGCRTCGESLTATAGSKIDKTTIAGTNIEVVYNAMLENLTDEEKAAYDELAYVKLTEAMMTSEALGHNFDVANGAEYVVKAYAGGVFSDRTCDVNEKLVVAIKCARCVVLNYEAPEGTYEGEAYDITAAAQYDNVAHGAIDATNLASGEFAWTNVVYYAYDAEGVWVADATAETDGAVATVLNPTADGVTTFECGNFSCPLCATAVEGKHYGNRTVESVNCYNAQNCVYCDTLMKDKSHAEITFTCYSTKNDGWYYCSICGEDADSPRLGKVTPHTPAVTVATAADCTTAGAWTITCGCVEEYGLEGLTLDGALFKNLETAAPEMWAAYTAEMTAATDALGVTTFNTDWLVIAALGHTDPGVFTTVKEATCYETGLEEKKCTVCGELLASNVLPTIAHTPATDFEVVLEATCTTDGKEVKKCTVCEAAGKEHICNEQVIARLGHTVVDETLPEGSKSVVDVALDPTCTTQGVTTYKCGRCDVAMDGTNGTANQTVTVPALGHDITLTLGTGKNCVYGAEVLEFSCANGCEIKAEDYADYLVQGVLYQDKVKDYLGTKGTDHFADYATWIAPAGVLYYATIEHNYTTFDTQTSGENGFIAPTASTLGSAYWICGECNARTYRHNSVTVADYNDASKNLDWATTAATAITSVSMAINGTSEVYAVADYFTVTAEGFVVKEAKLDELTDKIYAAYVAGGYASLEINAATVTLTLEEMTTKINIKAALTALKLSGAEVTITVALA